MLPLLISSRAWLVAAALVGVVGSAAAALDPAMGWVLLGVPASLLGWAWSRRVETLPLVLSDAAAIGDRGGLAVVRVRARLGRGRSCADPVAEAWWEADERQHSLPVRALGVSRVCGPWTVEVRGAAGRGAGALRIQVTVEERGRTHVVTGRYPSSAWQDGRFAPPLRLRDGRWQISDDWDRIV